MHTAFSPSLNRWKTLYQAAILEANKGLLPQRVSEAEEAVKARGREIFYGNATPEEKEAEVLEDALYTLRAFRTAWQHSETMIPDVVMLLLSSTLSHLLAGCGMARSN